MVFAEHQGLIGLSTLTAKAPLATLREEGICIWAYLYTFVAIMYISTLFYDMQLCFPQVYLVSIPSCVKIFMQVFMLRPGLYRR